LERKELGEELGAELGNALILVFSVLLGFELGAVVAGAE
jgi:hypothetical protein